MSYRHGTSTGYFTHNCRCILCSAYRRNRSPVPPATREDRSSDLTITHGTNASYVNHRCSCAACRAARAAIMRAYRRARRTREGGTS